MAAPISKLNGWIQDYKRQDNTSGVTGVVRWRNNHGNIRWIGTLQFNREKYSKVCETKDQAIKFRLSKEREMFGDNAPQRELFEEYLKD